MRTRKPSQSQRGTNSKNQGRERDSLDDHEFDDHFDDAHNDHDDDVRDDDERGDDSPRTERDGSGGDSKQGRPRRKKRSSQPRNAPKQAAKVKKEMLINAAQKEECRIAIIEDGVLEELYTERASQDNYVGNIYKGKVVNLEPSIQAAFVDFGVGKNGFLK